MASQTVDEMCVCDCHQNRSSPPLALHLQQGKPCPCKEEENYMCHCKRMDQSHAYDKLQCIYFDEDVLRSIRKPPTQFLIFGKTEIGKTHEMHHIMIRSGLIKTLFPNEPLCCRQIKIEVDLIDAARQSVDADHKSDEK